ncbi:MAG: trigger factor [Pseudomonadota bacterium]
MEIEVIQDEKLHKQFLLTYTASDIQECIVKEAENIQPEVDVNGFRPGKVPVDYIIRMYGEKLRIDAMNHRVTDDVRGIIEKNNFQLAVSPIYKFRERQEVGDDKYYLDLDFYLFPEVPDYDFSQATVERIYPDENSFEEIVDKNLLMLQVMTSEFEEKIGAISEHDRVKCKIDITIDEEPAPGLGGTLEVFIGHEQIPPEVETRLFGASQGQVLEFTHTYSEDDKNPFFVGVAGKKVGFKIDVEEVKAPIITELNEEKLKQMGFEDANHLIDVLRKNTQDMVDKMSAEKLHSSVIEHIKSNFDFDVPEIVVDQEAHQIAFNEASRVGNFDAVREVSEGSRKIAVEDEHYARAKNNLVTSFVLTDYARKNDIVVEEWEVKREMENHLEELTRMNSIRPELQEKNYNEFLLRVRTLVFERKVIASIIDKITVNDNLLSKDEFFDRVKVS